MRLTVLAPAKINLTLDVTGRRPDGYHELVSIFQTVDCCDRMTLTERAETVTLDTPGCTPCPTEQNTAYRAAQLFFAHTGMAGGAAITLHKRIPQQAGMGGGSADAAAVLAGLNRLYEAGLSREELADLGVRIGADVPFFLTGGTALVTGVGETIDPLPSLPPVYIVVAKPAEGVDTAGAYRRLDACSIARRPNHEAAVEAMRAQCWPALWAQVCNVFEPALALPGVAAIRREMEGFRPLAGQMTGSGSAVFGLFGEESVARQCAARLREQFPVAFVCRPCDGIAFA